MADLDPVAIFADLLRRKGSMTEAKIGVFLSDIGRILAGVGEAEGEGRAVVAAQRAIAPLLPDDSIKQARGAIMEIGGGYSLTLPEVNPAAEAIQVALDEDAQLLVGSHHDEKMGDRIRVTVVFAGTESET